MNILLKPIIRKEDTPDVLQDVIDIDGVQTAIVVRAYKTLQDAKAFDGVTVDEELDVQSFLDDRAAAQLTSVKQAAIDQAQDKVIQRLAGTMNSLLGFIASVHTLTAGQQQFVDDFRNDYSAWRSLADGN